MRLRDDHAFEQRKATAWAILDDLGDVRVEDTGRQEDVRRIEFDTDAPRAPLPPRSRLRYLEWWARDGRGWLRAKYQYDYLDRLDLSRSAYHRHDLSGRPDVLHAHCRPSGGGPSAPRFRSYEVDLLEAHEEFAELYGSDREIDCKGLRPLRSDD